MKIKQFLTNASCRENYTDVHGNFRCCSNGLFSWVFVKILFHMFLIFLLIAIFLRVTLTEWNLPYEPGCIDPIDRINRIDRISRRTESTNRNDMTPSRGALANESTWSTRINRINRTTESTELAKQQNQPTVKIWPLRGGSCQRINPNQPN